MGDVPCGRSPEPGDGKAVDLTYLEGDARFIFTHVDYDVLRIYDRVRDFEAHIPLSRLQLAKFLIGKWFAKQCAYHSKLQLPLEVVQQWMNSHIRETLLWVQCRSVNTVQGQEMSLPVPLNSEACRETTGFHQNRLSSQSRSTVVL
jgi:hypothetical protein